MRTTTGPQHAQQSSLVSNQERGEAIKRRRLALDIGSHSKFEAVSEGKFPRSTVKRAEDGNASPNTYDAIELWLDRAEARQGGPTAVESELPAEPIRIEMHGVYGIDQIIVTGPVDRPDEVAETIGKVMDRIRAQAEGPGPE